MCRLSAPPARLRHDPTKKMDPNIVPPEGLVCKLSIQSDNGSWTAFDGYMSTDLTFSHFDCIIEESPVDDNVGGR
jgi:hypothetical protein